MRKFILVLFSLLCLAGANAQTKKTTQSQTKKTTATTQRKTTAKSSAKTKTNAKQKTTTSKQKATYSNSNIRGLQNQRAAVQKKIKEQEKALRENKANVSQKLKDLMLLNGEIDQRQKNIEDIQTDIHHLEGNMDVLNSQLKTLEEQLKERQHKSVKRLRYMARHRTLQDKLMFVFSAKNLFQMYRRLRFVREYAQYQRAQGEILKAKQAEVDNKHKQLQQVKNQKNQLLSKGQQEKTKLEDSRTQQQQMVQGLQKEQKTIQGIIAEQQKKDAALNAQIDRLVEIEIQKARERAAAEARRKAAAAEAAKRREAELARKKAEAEARAAENARRIAEAKAREERLKEEARKAAEAEAEARRARAAAEEAAKKKASEQAAASERKAREKEAKELAAKAAAAEKAAKAAEAKKAAAEQAAREAESQRVAAERKKEADAARAEKEMAEAKKNAEEAAKFSSVDRMMNSGFEANRGRLPMPITGGYKIVSHFGQYNVEGLKGVTLDNKGINILGSAGCQARSVYDGEVSAVVGYAGSMVVMVRHGVYISVYANLKSVSVSKGQKVQTGQTLGAVGSDNILQFQLRKERAKLNPESWLRR